MLLVAARWCSNSNIKFCNMLIVETTELLEGALLELELVLLSTFNFALVEVERESTKIGKDLVPFCI